jgi:hypothetical protein
MPTTPAPETKTPGDQPGKPELDVTYNGLDRDIEYNPRAAAQALLEHAMNTFDVRENRHLMALFTEAGVELDPLGKAVEDFGVKPGDVLVLRPSAVRGGKC